MTTEDGTESVAVGKRLFRVTPEQRECLGPLLRYAFRVGKVVSQCHCCGSLFIRPEETFECHLCDGPRDTNGGVMGHRRFPAEQHDAVYHGSRNGGEW